MKHTSETPAASNSTANNGTAAPATRPEWEIPADDPEMAFMLFVKRIGTETYSPTTNYGYCAGFEYDDSTGKATHAVVDVGIHPKMTRTHIPIADFVRDWRLD